MWIGTKGYVGREIEMKDILNNFEAAIKAGLRNAKNNQQVVISGIGEAVPKSGSIFCDHGLISLSHGLCEQIKNQTDCIGFTAELVLTPINGRQ